MTRCSIFILLVTLVAVGGESFYQLAFSAGFGRDVTFAQGRVIVYDQILLNTGNVYNRTMGIFYCPQSGVYAFHFHVMSQYGKEAYLQLHHNHNKVASAYCYPTRHTASGNSAILHLKTVDQVWVEAARTAYLHGTAANSYTTFSGYLISPSFDVKC
ncbi:complement C1q-like protein 4 isoform X2 [Haliotis rufescens]|uniref:complement C1q-like protein 4 isoform X1 n=1 Tax=Haliotis rufescens TaxID=6454 RepID=UPI00201F050E|nr:complement C1q-like protein 4 isoform X1 [Haliotis rufescens]XP_048242330.1 complement C1q-like protein 4 isoform X2 [Haliotis rufescens]XP_048242331.1 complement C1q-like protein 4 isoform X2 [Haliotis rufescens]